MAVNVVVILSPALGAPAPLMFVPIVNSPARLIFIWLFEEIRDVNIGLPWSET